MHVDKALDFGCRRSYLPQLLAAAGYGAYGIDRDGKARDDQIQLAAALHVKPVPVQWWDQAPGIPLPYKDNWRFAAITAVWALQHNLPIAAQTKLVRSIAAVLKPGGSLLIVASYALVTMIDENRADPQIIFSGPDHLKHVIEPSGLTLTKQDYFWYEHNTENGEYCGPEQANATCYVLKKPLPEDTDTEIE